MTAPAIPTTISHHSHGRAVTQTNNITVNGASDPHKTAQQRYNSALVRNLPTRLI